MGSQVWRFLAFSRLWDQFLTSYHRLVDFISSHRQKPKYRHWLESCSPSGLCFQCCILLSLLTPPTRAGMQVGMQRFTLPKLPRALWMKKSCTQRKKQKESKVCRVFSCVLGCCSNCRCLNCTFQVHFSWMEELK